MLKPRLIAIVLLHRGFVIQSYGFERYLPVGDLSTTIQFLCDWGIDEICVLDIDATRENRSTDYLELEKGLERCNIPVAFGGGLNDLEAVRSALGAGVDKVVVNSAFQDNKKLIKEIANSFGSQCAMVSIDAKSARNRFYHYDYRNKNLLGRPIEEVLVDAEQSGAGEIILNSVDRDGTGSGLNLLLADAIPQSIEVPVVLCGGAGKGEHLMEALKYSKVHSVAAANLFHHTEHSVTLIKSDMNQKGGNQRMHNKSPYEQFQFDITGRPFK